MRNLPIDQIVSAPWWPELLSVKDSLPWTALEARYGVSAVAIRAALASIGQSKVALPAGRKPRGAAAPDALPTLAAGPVAPLAATPPAAIAPKERAPAPTLDRLRAQIGSVSDAEIARLAGVDVAVVKTYRKEHGLPAYRRLPPVAAAAPPVAGLPVKRAPAASSVMRRRASEGKTVQVRVSEPVLVAPLSVAPVVAVPAERSWVGCDPVRVCG